MEGITMTAEEARRIYDNREKINAENWFIKYKYELFEMILDSSLNGINQIELDSVVYGRNQAKKDHLITNLKDLGYKLNETSNSIFILW
jgi:hypothetical protein